MENNKKKYTFDYIVYYNEKRKTFETKSKTDDNIKETNLVVDNDVTFMGDYVAKYNAERDVKKLNGLLKDSYLEVRKCKTCGKFFIMTAAEQEWYIRKGFQFPNNCSVCRERKRMDKSYRNFYNLCKNAAENHNLGFARFLLENSGFAETEISEVSEFNWINPVENPTAAKHEMLEFIYYVSCNKLNKVPNIQRITPDDLWDRYKKYQRGEI